METAADRLAMLSALGGSTVSAPDGQFTGLLETDFVQVGDPPVDSYAPKILARTSDVRAAAAVVGAELVIDGDTYTVRSVQDDFTGMTTLILEAS